MKYPEVSLVEVHGADGWRPAGELRALSHNQASFSYLEDYVFGGNAAPVSLSLPVGLWPEPMTEGMLGPQADLRPPSFVYDLVPQGRGRKFLLDNLKLADSDDMVMPLVMAGAFNPIGCLRLTKAVDFYTAEAAKDPGAQSDTGFTLDDIQGHSQDFLDHISLHAMLASGTTGVQGVAPKFLLTTNSEGRWFADLALADSEAREHWLVKLPRGKSEEDRMVLRNEAAYLRLASACGIRSFHEPMLVREMLFVRRFDRLVKDRKVVRLHQESLASVVGQRGFGIAHSQQSLLDGMRRVVSDPLGETIEFIKRDVLNLAMRNTDNHARNTAVQRTVDGRVQLTPIFDFAPMFKDPEIVPRTCQWKRGDGVKQTDWREIVGELNVSAHERAQIIQALCDFAGTLGRLEDTARDCGVENEILEQCLRSIEEQFHGINSLSELLPVTAKPKRAKRAS